MELLEKIKQEYGYTTVKQVGKDRIQTNKGIKNVRIWEDERLLQWHISWREECSRPPFIMTDRMIRTINNNMEVPYEKGWLTLHDEVATLSPIRQAEQKWGNLFGHMFQYGLEQDKRKLSFVEHEYFFPSIEQIQQQLHLIAESEKKLISTCYKEARGRADKASDIIEKNNHVVLPICDPIHSLTQLKEDASVLFFEGTAKNPEIGYRSFSMFVLEWWRKEAESSLFLLLDGISERFELIKSRQLSFLIAELLYPTEYIECVTNIEDTEKWYKRVDDMKQTWNEKQQLVQVLVEWSNKRTEKEGNDDNQRRLG
ncbi:hypothetical protein [Alkalihalobacterium bogoriense]|uniref:hypothetical protein n=1 Tax=Alkalihalobacterium bogoriense TaxID=246272 RepID=UPI0004797C3D|nr:hypothetical protein [Alkalihalobacterium bogoriense]